MTYFIIGLIIGTIIFAGILYLDRKSTTSLQSDILFYLFIGIMVFCLLFWPAIVLLIILGVTGVQFLRSNRQYKNPDQIDNPDS